MDGAEDFTASWAAQLRELHEAAGRPTGSRIARHAATRTPPLKGNVYDQRWSDWRNGLCVPSDLGVAKFLIDFLRQLAQQENPDYQIPSDNWWLETWRQARNQRANPGGRPLVKHPVSKQRQPQTGVKVAENLRLLSNEHTTVKIILYPAQEYPVARDVDAIFRLAGWKTTFIDTPQEGYVHRYLEGIEVSGCNSFLVSSVAEALGQAGLPALNVKHLPNEINPDNPKYAHVEHAVRITVGYTHGRSSGLIDD